jgi:hypothetical protein
MFVEIILTRDDFVAALEQLLPLTIHLDEDDTTDRWLRLDRATGVELVPDEGLRLACPAEIRWSVAGVGVPVRLHTLQVRLRPEVVVSEEGPTLVFVVTVEEADFKGIPELVDRSIVKAINGALARRELAWSFTKDLTRTVEMPKLLDPIESLSIEVAWGERRSDTEAVVIAVSLHLRFNRRE